LLLRQRLYGIKVGTVWAIFPDDLIAFMRTRRSPGRPRKGAETGTDQALAGRMVSERKRAGTDLLLRKGRRQAEEPRLTSTATRPRRKR
jgi:hypothetical protein